MTSIKRKISAFVAAFAMMGAVTVPATAKYVTNEPAITVSAASKVAKSELYILDNNPRRYDVKANTKFKAEPSESSETVASVKKATTGNKVYFTRCYITDEGKIWYYSKYDKGWVNLDNIILGSTGVDKFFFNPLKADVIANTKFKAEPNESSKTVASVKKATTGEKVRVSACVVTYEGAWYYSEYDNGWVKRDHLIMYKY